MQDRSDYERNIAKKLQQQGNQSVEDQKLLNEHDLSTKKQSPIGEYDGSTKNPIGKTPYTGSQMKGEWPRLQAMTKAPSSGGGLGVNQAKGGK